MTPGKIGIIAPTYNRPDFARFLALQMAAQSRRPDVVCFHQNGTDETYAWAVDDLRGALNIEWIHTPEKLKQEEWYAVPLERLIAAECTQFFWCDHDDIYDTAHVAEGAALLDGDEFDFAVNGRAGFLMLKPEFRYWPDIRFTAHDPGGMSASMCFNRAFAVELLKDLRANAGALAHADQVLTRVTKPKFRCTITDRKPTTAYVCHPTTVSSSHWLASRHVTENLDKTYGPGAKTGE